jgi:hypothetical protein
MKALNEIKIQKRNHKNKKVCTAEYLFLALLQNKDMSFVIFTLLKQKHEKEQIQVQYSNGAKDVLFLESKQKCSLFEKNVLFSETNHDLCLKK